LAGIDIIDEAKRLLRVPTLRGMKMPNIRIRRASLGARTLGKAYFNQHMIRMTDYPGIDKYDVYETLSHELSHLRTGRHGGTLVGSRREGAHGQTWRDIFSNVVFEGYRRRIPILRATHGQVSDVMRGRVSRNPISGYCGCCE
jgi:predicted SprT family Zn-dependent metalloprotease